MKMLIELKKIRKVIVYGLYLLIILLPIGGALYLSFPVFVHNFIFYVFSTGTEYGNDVHFQWIGITAAIAAVGFIANLYWNKINFNANIKSKSRIDWMKTVRLLISEYVSNALLAYNENKKLNIKKLYTSSSKDGVNEIANRSNEVIHKYNLAKYQLKLYISEADDNEELNTKINNVDTKLAEIRAKINNPSENNIGIKKLYDVRNEDEILEYQGDINEIELNDTITELMKTAQKYFKKEWERAKRGE